MSTITPELAGRWHYRVRVRLVRERCGAFGPVLRRAGDIAEVLGKELGSLDREQFACCHLDAGRVRGCKVERHS